MSSAASPRTSARRALNSKRAFAAGALALGGLASGYLHAIRLSPAAYASTTCPAGTEAELAACLTGLGAGVTTVELTADILLTSPLPQIDLTTRAVDLTIDGNGDYSISGGGTQPGLWFRLSADDTLQITDLTMQNLRSLYGGAVYVKDYSSFPSGTFIVENSHFNDNRSDNDGGALYAYDAIAFTVRNSTFDGNRAATHGGAVYAQGSVTIQDSEFTGNDAVSRGGAVYAKVDAAAYDSSFVDNYADRRGGAIFFKRNLFLEGSSFDSNIAVEEGGAVYGPASGIPGVAVLARSTFQDNVGADGGAVYVKSSSANISVEQSTFSGNAVDDSTVGWGGAIYSAAPATITESTFSQNIARRGGAIAAARDLTVDNTTFYANAAPASNGEGGAVRVSTSRSARFDFTTFAGNTTGNASGGSALWLSGSNTLNWSATVVSSSGAAAPCRFFPGYSLPYTTAVDTYVLATDSGGSCDVSGLGSDDTFTSSALQLGSLADNGGLTDTLLPAGTSPLVTQAPSSNLGTGVTTDQRNAARSTAFTIGAVQVPGQPAPGAPNAPIATGDDGRATVASPTTTAGGTPTSWVISAYSVDDTYLIPLDDTCAINSTSGNCTITGLTNGEPYRFRALPSNSRGQGRLSPLSNPVIPAVNPNPPAPTPGLPPSAPLDVSGEPADRSAVVSWRAPADSGSFPVSNYKVTATPGGRSCLTTTLTCTVTGLTNGTGYTFAVEALNGAGWGRSSAPSAVVTPGTDPVPSITMGKEPRQRHGRRDLLTATGTTTGIEPGTELTPFIRLDGETSFRQGGAMVTVQSNGSFRWSRHVPRGRGLAVYMSWEDVESNRIRWARVR